MRQWALILLGGLLLGVLPGTAWASKAGPVFDRYGTTIHATFEPKRNAARFIPHTDTLRLLSQIVSALIIVGGLLAKMRRDETQMEGIASMVLKVGFIASLPIIGGKLEDTCGWMANATGHSTFPYTDRGETYTTTYTPVASNQVTPVVRKIFELTNQWTIGSTPALDQLAETSDPEEGQEEAWAENKDNWVARTVRWKDDPGAATWAAVAGAFRVATIHLIVLGVDLVCTGIVFLTYFAEVLRLFLFHAGLAILPVFIAGLGLECMKNQSVRYILGLVSLGLWPVGWAIANIGTVRLINVATNFIHNLLIREVTQQYFGTADPTIAVAMPHMTWGVMVTLAALTLGLCLWMLLGLICGPLLISRVLTAGAQMMGVVVGAAAGAPTISSTNMTGGNAALLAHAIAVAAGRASAMMSQGAATAGSAAVNGASMLGRVGGSKMGAVAASMASRFDPGVIEVAEASGGAAAGMVRSLGGSGGSGMRGALCGASIGLELAAPIDLGHKGQPAPGSGRMANQHRPRPWQPLFQLPPKSE